MSDSDIGPKVNGGQILSPSVISEKALSLSSIADLVFGSRSGSVLTLGGVDSEHLRFAIDQLESNLEKRRAIFGKIEPKLTSDAIIDRVIDLLAKAAFNLWPTWFTDISFAECDSSAAGKVAAGIKAKELAIDIPGVSAYWAESATTLVLEGKLPRVRGTLAAIELKQLALTISRYGLVLLVDVSEAIGPGSSSIALVHALEWIAQNSGSALVVLFSELPANEPPFDRILYGARQFTTSESVAETGSNARPSSVDPQSWLVPWRGSPHPLSEIEQRLAKALENDVELGPLFRFNQVVHTTRGSQPKVDLVWIGGKLVVELDGYGSHGNRVAFMYDRHRDYELMLSGYTVLRLANDEIEQDLQKAIDKIRDLVVLRQQRTNLEM